MIRRRARLHVFALTSVLVAIGACTSDSAVRPLPLAGSYAATSIRVARPGMAPVDAVTLGGSLTINIAADNTTTGTLFLPASVTGGAPFTASMAGTAVRDGDVVRFQQAADTFVRDLRWDVYAIGLLVSGQPVGGATYDISLEHQ